MKWRKKSKNQNAPLYTKFLPVKEQKEIEKTFGATYVESLNTAQGEICVRRVVTKVYAVRTNNICFCRCFSLFFFFNFFLKILFWLLLSRLFCFIYLVDSPHDFIHTNSMALFFFCLLHFIIIFCYWIGSLSACCVFFYLF